MTTINNHTENIENLLQISSDLNILSDLAELKPKEIDTVLYTLKLINIKLATAMKTAKKKNTKVISFSVKEAERVLHVSTRKKLEKLLDVASEVLGADITYPDNYSFTVGFDNTNYVSSMYIGGKLAKGKYWTTNLENVFSLNSKNEKLLYLHMCNHLSQDRLIIGDRVATLRALGYSVSNPSVSAKRLSAMITSFSKETGILVQAPKKINNKTRNNTICIDFDGNGILREFNVFSKPENTRSLDNNDTIGATTLENANTIISEQQKQIKQLKEENEKQKEMNQKLDEENTTLKEQNESLLKQLAELRQQLANNNNSNGNSDDDTWDTDDTETTPTFSDVEETNNDYYNPSDAFNTYDEEDLEF